MGTLHSLHDHCMLAVSLHAGNARLAAACVTAVPHRGYRTAVHALASALWVCAAGSHAPVEHGSVTLSAAAMATAASAALPPLRSILSPISDARGCDEAATPCVHTTFDRRDTNGNASDIAQAARCTRPRCTLTHPVQDSARGAWDRHCSSESEHQKLESHSYTFGHPDCDAMHAVDGVQGV
jgi:hypothetical protein